MLLLAFFLPPLALYLIVLGWINRRPRPVMLAGAWDFAGVLFAISGFVLVGGPAFLGSLDEQSRLFWLLGETEPAAAGRNSVFWIAIRLFYFAVAAGGAAVMLWRSRRLTSVYNVDPPAVFAALERTFQGLGLAPLRSGDFFLIDGRTPDAAPKAPPAEGIQAAPDLQPASPVADPVTVALPGQSTALQVDAFPLMRHVTLRWDPADAPLRREVERALGQALAEVQPPEQEPMLAWVLMTLGVSLFFFALFGAAFVVLHNLLAR